jgi:hypothetical protein
LFVVLGQIKIVVSKELEGYKVKSVKVKTPLSNCLTEFIVVSFKKP